MIEAGLVSVTFRGLSPAEIIQAAREAGLSCIEWGGDVHVPPGDPVRARQIGERTREAGLSVCSYGSYYRAGCGCEEAFPAALDAAAALGAPIIRIWAGNKGSADFSPREWDELVSESRRIGIMARQRNMTVAFECHGGTATDDYEASLRLMRETALDSVRMYWQPDQRRDEAYNCRSAEALAPFTEIVHTFHWSGAARYPLSEGADSWKLYLDRFSQSGLRACLLEFMHDDRPESLPGAARTLLSWLRDRPAPGVS